MTEPMTLERFEQLANAYGSVVARWPQPERAAAIRLASQPAAIAILAQAATLDDVLDAWVIEATPDALRERILAEAPNLVKSFAGRARLWWSGVGIAAALAGAVAGTAGVAIVQPIDVSAAGGTSFGDVGPQEG